jgi:hypothetical protein
MSATSKSILFLALLFPVCALARNAAIATGIGETKLNGKALVHASAVFAGDELQTAADSAIVLHGKGFTVQVGPMADSFLEKTALRLGTGSLEAKGLINVLAGEIRIISDSASTAFKVSRSSGTVCVAAKSGLLIIRRGRERVELKPGESREFDENNVTMAATPSIGRGNLKKAGAVVTATGTAVGTVVASHLKNSKNALVSISPSRP